MRIKSLLAAAALMVGAQAASASYVFTEVVLAGGGAGNEVHQYYAKINPTGTESAATGLQSVDGHMTITAGKFKFKFIDTNTDGIPDAAVTGQGISDTVARTGTAATLGTFIRAGDPTAGSFFAAVVTPLNQESKDIDGDGIADPGFDPSVNYANVKDFRVAGVIQGGKDIKAVSDSKGALFAMAVVPTGTAVSFSGSLAPDAGPITPFAFAVPEPGSLSVIGVAGLLLGRRRRTA